MPSGSNRTPSQFRTPMNDLAEDFFDEFFVKKGVKDFSFVLAGKEKKVTIEEYLGKKRGKDMTPTEPDSAFHATGKIVDQLSTAIVSDPDGLKKVIRILTGRAEELLNEGDDISIENIRAAKPLLG